MPNCNVVGLIGITASLIHGVLENFYTSADPIVIALDNTVLAWQSLICTEDTQVSRCQSNQALYLIGNSQLLVCQTGNGPLTSI